MTKQILHPLYQILFLAVSASLVSACMSIRGPISSPESPVGSWASGNDVSACQTAPITYFSSDGVIIVFLSAEGPIHSFGRWDVVSGQLTMTHNDFPLDGGGVSKEPVLLEIIELNPGRFVTQNPKGDIRKRVRCDDLTLRSGFDHETH